MKPFKGQQYEKLLIKISKMYYKDDLTQKAISQKLKIKRPDISRLLKEARKQGIVNINIRSNKFDFSDIERQIEKKFKINEAIVIPSEDNENYTKNKLGEAAAYYLERIIDNNVKIGISWGTTIQEMTKYLSPTREYKNITVCQLTGGISGGNLDIQSSELCRKIAEIYKGKYSILFAPAFVKDKETRNAIIHSNKDISETLNKAKNCDIAIVGIGAIQNSTNLLWKNIFYESDIKNLIQCGAVGDICGRFFNINGIICSEEMDCRTIGVSLDELKKIRNVIGIGGGKNKIEAIYAALKGGLIKVIIMDYEAAMGVLNKI